MDFKKITRYLIFLVTIFLILTSSFETAQAQGAPEVCTRGIVRCGNPCRGYPHHCSLCDVPELILNIIQFLFVCVIPPLALIAIIGAGIIIMVSGDNPALQSRARSIIKNTIIGLVIAYGAWILVGTFLTLIGVADWTGLSSWWQLNIQCDGGAPPPTVCP